MKKILLTVIFLFSILNLLQAQDGYVKFYTDTSFFNKKVKVFQGEIFPYAKTTSPTKINVTIGNNVMTDLALTLKNFDTIQNINKKYLSYKDSLVQLKNGGVVYINGTYLAPNDTITLLSDSGKKIIQVLNGEAKDIQKSECGKSFRVVITNTPTIFYNTESLSPYIKPIEPNPESEPVANSGWPWWYYLIIVIGVGAIAFTIWKFVSKKKVKDNNVIFYGKSLKDFAKPYGGLNYLSSINSPGLIPNESEWDKIKDKKEGAKKIKDLQGVKITIKEPESSFGFGESKSAEHKNVSTEREWEIPSSESVIQNASQSSGNDNFPQLLKQVERNIINEINKSGSRENGSSNEFNRFNKEILELRSEKNRVESENREFVSTISQLQNDSKKFEANIELLNLGNLQTQSELKEFNEKVIRIEFLSGYCDSVLAYLKFCNQVVADAYSFLNRIEQQNSNFSILPGQLLIKFQNNINNLPVGNWIQIILDIKDSGLTNSRLIKNSFKQLGNDDEKKKQFQRLLFSELLIKYSSSVLILAEEFSNLEHFQIQSENVNEAKTIFRKHTGELINKVKSIGLENKYVPLFKNFEEFAGQTELVDRDRSLVYKKISGLEKGSIIEIISYGVKTNFEDTKTLIILA